MPGAEILRLGADPLAHVLQCLDADSLARLCCTCRELRAASENPSLWEALARDRWFHVHTTSFAGPVYESTDGSPTNVGNARTSMAYAVVSWKRLFAEENGWEPLRLRHTVPQQYRPPRFGAGVELALQPVWLPSGATNCDDGSLPVSKDEGDLLLAVGKPNCVELWHVSPAAFTQGFTSGVTSAAGHEGGANGSCSGINQQGRGSSGSNNRGDKGGTILPGTCCGDQGCGTGAGGGCAAAPVQSISKLLALDDGAASFAWVSYGEPPGGRGANTTTPASSGGGGGGGEGGPSGAALSALGGPGRISLTAAAASAAAADAADAAAAAAAAPPAGAAAPAAPDEAAASAAVPPLRLAVGTYSGRVIWTQYEAQEAAAPQLPSSVHRRSGRLRVLSTTACGSNGQLAELHVLPATSGAAGAGAGVEPGVGVGAGGAAGAAGTGAGGILAALQRAGTRSAVQLFDVATQRHLATVRDPFESHHFVCCRPAVAAATAVDPHVLLVGSVHSAICGRCAGAPLPSLCNHKSRTATAALSTLDVRCGGLTQRFGLQHRSLYPRLATAREHYVFTSHAGTALEVYDRRAMSVPLYSRARLPSWPLVKEELLGEERWEVGEERWEVGEEEEGGEGEEEEDREEPLGGWQEGPAPVLNRHCGLWLEANDDVLLGRADNGTLWLWDLSTTLGWARGPDRSGIWHYWDERAPWQRHADEGALGDEQLLEVAAARDGNGAGGGGSSLAAAAAASVGVDHGGAAPARRPSAWPLGGPICLGWMASGGITSMTVLASGVGPSPAFFSLGLGARMRKCVVGSTMAGV
ncbi:hypothetical protein PLESTF_001247700 [Pleodorina starrii]|nr:hypothetical protein PLESTF_001247700 [Pleodorina starrii]